jgi:hypothetical protein
MRNVHLITKNLYITSDEEIKEGGYVFWECKIYTYREFMKMRTPVYTDYFSIILTTDQDLIKDGVQAIDNEFLEWFVKNPSCERVEVNIMNKGYNKIKDIPYQECYKIIIPQEEPKQYPIGGYAPGYYSCTCVTCKTEFMGDKLAVQCEPCAIEMVSVKIVENNDSCQIEEPKQEFLEKISSIDLSPEFQQLISDNLDDLTSYEPKQETNLEDSIYQAIGLAANEQGIINQALATSKVMDVLKKTNL